MIAQGLTAIDARILSNKQVRFRRVGNRSAVECVPRMGPPARLRAHPCGFCRRLCFTHGPSTISSDFRMIFRSQKG